MATVRRNQLRAPTGRLDSSNVLLLLGVQGSNAIHGKRLPWRDHERVVK